MKATENSDHMPSKVVFLPETSEDSQPRGNNHQRTVRLVSPEPEVTRAVRQRTVRLVSPEPEETRTVRYIVPEGQEEHLEVGDHHLCCGDINRHPPTKGVKQAFPHVKDPKLIVKVANNLVKQAEEESQRRVARARKSKEQSPEVEILSQTNKAPKHLKSSVKPPQNKPISLQPSQEDFPGASSDWPTFPSDEEEENPVILCEKDNNTSQETREAPAVKKKKEVPVIQLWSSDDEDEIVEEIHKSEMRTVCAQTVVSNQ